jgi:hypothetical protein
MRFFQKAKRRATEYIRTYSTTETYPPRKYVLSIVRGWHWHQKKVRHFSLFFFFPPIISFDSKSTDPQTSRHSQAPDANERTHKFPNE